MMPIAKAMNTNIHSLRNCDMQHNDLQKRILYYILEHEFRLARSSPNANSKASQFTKNIPKHNTIDESPKHSNRNKN